jgi:hypothetical protein
VVYESRRDLKISIKDVERMQPHAKLTRTRSALVMIMKKKVFFSPLFWAHKTFGAHLLIKPSGSSGLQLLLRVQPSASRPTWLVSGQAVRGRKRFLRRSSLSNDLTPKTEKKIEKKRAIKTKLIIDFLQHIAMLFFFRLSYFFYFSLG